MTVTVAALFAGYGGSAFQPDDSGGAGGGVARCGRAGRDRVMTAPYLPSSVTGGAARGGHGVWPRDPCHRCRAGVQNRTFRISRQEISGSWTMEMWKFGKFDELCYARAGALARARARVGPPPGGGRTEISSRGSTPPSDSAFEDLTTTLMRPRTVTPVPAEPVPTAPRVRGGPGGSGPRTAAGGPCLCWGWR